MMLCSSVSAIYFYPRPPRGGRRGAAKGQRGVNVISIHALREKGDTDGARSIRTQQNFYPRPPRGGRRWRGDSVGLDQVFLSTPSARRATLRQRPEHLPLRISIHALREEGDGVPSFLPLGRNISIHALREEGDRGGVGVTAMSQRFLSTPSARRATRWRRDRWCRRTYFYPRPPRGGRPTLTPSLSATIRFLSTPSARRATTTAVHALDVREFLSTPSARRATSRAVHCNHPICDFYPRPPRGGRPSITSRASRSMGFLSTPSARRATICFWMLEHRIQFLSTPSARRATGSPVILFLESEFLSTPSARRATEAYGLIATGAQFLSTPSARRATLEGCVKIVPLLISIHALREEGDPGNAYLQHSRHYFYPRPP